MPSPTVLLSYVYIACAGVVLTAALFAVVRCVADYLHARRNEPNQQEQP